MAYTGRATTALHPKDAEMFQTLKGFLMGVLVSSAVWIGGAYTRQVVRTPEGFRLLPRATYTFHDIYVDTTNWGPADFVQNPEIVKALAQAGMKQAQSVLSQDYDNAVARFKSEAQAARQQMEIGLKRLFSTGK
jgi:hypothetical protein